MSFNYDRVVEELAGRSDKQVRLIKLHGTVPEPDELVNLIASSKPVTTLYTPGPHKLAAARGPLKEEWEAAETALQKAEHLIVVGYSFPATDPIARSFVLKNSRAGRVTLVVGPDGAGRDSKAMFSRAGTQSLDSELYAQQFLAEGSARRFGDRFRA